MLVLMKNDIWEFANSIVAPPANPKDLAAHNLKDMKARRIILNEVKDHLILIYQERTQPRTCGRL
jgi:hypothetical protein